MTFESGITRSKYLLKNAYSRFLPLGERHAIYCLEGGPISKDTVENEPPL